MLNEERVKLMVKLASYDAKEGKKDFKISSYYKKDYVSLNRWSTVLWTTAAYLLILGLFGITYMEQLLELSLGTICFVVIGAVVLYLVMLIVSCVAAGKYYREKHIQARQRVKKYSHNLLVLRKVYEKEKL